MTDAEAAKAGLEKVTDFVEDKGVDGAARGRRLARQSFAAGPYGLERLRERDAAGVF